MPSWPVRVRRCSPVAGSHSRTVLSAPPLASSRPSGLNATAADPAGVAGQGAPVLAGGRVPQPHRLVAAAAGQQPPVRAERHAVNPTQLAKPFWRAFAMAGQGVSELGALEQLALPLGQWLLNAQLVVGRLVAGGRV